MRVAALIAIAFPLFAAAQVSTVSCDADSTALCCFSSEDPTSDNFAALSDLPDFQGAQLPVDSQAQIGLLCNPLDVNNACTNTVMCCTDNSYNGVAAFGCTVQATATDSTDSTDGDDGSDSTTTTDDSTTDSSDTSDSTTTSS